MGYSPGQKVAPTGETYLQHALLLEDGRRESDGIYANATTVRKFYLHFIWWSGGQQVETFTAVGDECHIVGIKSAVFENF